MKALPVITVQTLAGECLILPKHAKLKPNPAADQLTTQSQIRLKAMTAPTKRDEFLRSRWLMKNILKTNTEPMTHADGDILWPPGMCGSLTHKRGDIALLIGDSSQLKSVGIDLEFRKSPIGVGKKIATPSEQELIIALTSELVEEEAVSLIFSAKEALFKALFPLGRKMFWFDEANITSATMQHGEILMTLYANPTAHNAKISQSDFQIQIQPITVNASDNPTDQRHYWLAVCPIVTT
jgi:4'-phosphopantetheinyl transferase EntD